MINDFSELVAEVTERSGISDFANRADMLIGMAETALSKRLRLSDQETAVTLTTDSGGDVPLPGDFQEMKVVRVGSHELLRLPLAAILNPGRCGYAVRAATLKSSYADTEHSCVYWASIPSLSASGTNWLLDAEPELYLQAALLQAYTVRNDIDRAEATAGYLSGLIEAANEADRLKRHAGARVNLANTFG